MPKDKLTFIDKNLPGDYDELLDKYQPNNLVTEMEYYMKKTVYLLQAITDGEKCELVPVDQANTNHQDIIRVLLLSHLNRKTERI
jgi:hypothetical protein